MFDYLLIHDNSDMQCVLCDVLKMYYDMIHLCWYTSILLA